MTLHRFKLLVNGNTKELVTKELNYYLIAKYLFKEQALDLAEQVQRLVESPTDLVSGANWKLTYEAIQYAELKEVVFESSNVDNLFSFDRFIVEFCDDEQIHFIRMPDSKRVKYVMELDPITAMTLDRGINSLNETFKRISVNEARY